MTGKCDVVHHREERHAAGVSDGRPWSWPSFRPNTRGEGKDGRAFQGKRPFGGMPLAFTPRGRLTKLRLSLA